MISSHSNRPSIVVCSVWFEQHRASAIAIANTNTWLTAQLRQNALSQNTRLVTVGMETEPGPVQGVSRVSDSRLLYDIAYPHMAIGPRTPSPN